MEQKLILKNPDESGSDLKQSMEKQFPHSFFWVE